MTSSFTLLQVLARKYQLVAIQNTISGLLSFSRLASASASPTIGHCKELNKLCRQIRNDEVEMRVWPLKGSPRIVGILMQPSGITATNPLSVL